MGGLTGTEVVLPIEQANSFDAVFCFVLMFFCDALGSSRRLCLYAASKKKITGTEVVDQIFFCTHAAYKSKLRRLLPNASQRNINTKQNTASKELACSIGRGWRGYTRCVRWPGDEPRHGIAGRSRGRKSANLERIRR